VNTNIEQHISLKKYDCYHMFLVKLNYEGMKGFYLLLYSRALRNPFIITSQCYCKLACILFYLTNINKLEFNALGNVALIRFLK